LLAAASVGLVIGLVSAPEGIRGAASWWFGERGVVQAVLDAGFGEAESARVGDIVLRYEYPAYTGLDPQVVENSSGEVSAPPGTLVEVQLRTAARVESGALVVYGEPGREAALGEDGRRLSARFPVRAEGGVWRMLTFLGGEERSSREFPITVEPDLAPQVTLDGPDTVQVGFDRPVALAWHAKDDFGLRRVTVLVNGEERRAPLRELRGRVANLEDLSLATPQDLGLKVGDRVRVAVGAWDNDAVSGSKRGVSREIEVVVLGPEGLRERDADRFVALRDQLVDLLADFLTEAWPPATESDGMARWGQRVAERVAFLAELPPGGRGEFDQGVIEELEPAITRLVRYTQVSFTPGDRSAVSGAALATTSELRDDAIEAVEDAVLALDRVLRMQAHSEVLRLANQIERQAESLAKMLETSEPDAVAMLAELEALKRRLAKLEAAASRMEQGGLRESVNQRESEMSSLVAEIERAIREGRMDEARELMKRLQQQMKQFAEHLNDQQRSARQKADEIQERADALKKELQELEDAQRALQERTQAMRERADGQRAEEIGPIWEQIEAEVGRLRARESGYLDGLKAAKRAFHETTRFEEVIARTDRLERTVLTRDLRNAQRAVSEVEAAVAHSRITWVSEASKRRVPGPGGPDLAAMEAHLRKISELLARLDRAANSSTPEAQAGARAMEQEERALQERLQEAMKQAQEVAREYPVEPKGMEEAMKEAGREMEDARGSLGEGKPLPAEGAQGAAADRLREAREALEQAQESASRQREAAEQGGQGGERGGREEGSEGENPGEGEGRESGDRSSEFDPSRFELSTGERRLDAEAYRRALLQGMEGEVPEAWSAEKKRYYEELVRQ
jgi:hypothetical protein